MPNSVAWHKPAALVAWAAFGFLAGILARAASPFEAAPFWILTVLVAAGCLLGKSPKIRACGVFVLAAAFGVWRFDLTLPGTDDDVTSRVGSAVTLAGRVTDVRAYDAVITVKTADGRAAWTRSRVSVAGRGRVVGETVSVSCALAPDQKADARSTLFEMRQGIFARCRGAARVTRVKSPSSWDVAALLFRWREIMSRRVRSVLPGDEGALLAGILYGERGLSRAANLSFRNAGMTHLIAVSGSNITLIVSFFVPLFILLGYRRKSAIILSGLGILLFVLFVGAQASVVRAALMGWLALLARVFGRKAEAMRLLAIAAAIIVIFDPWALAFDAGFALSFLATWGLIAWARPIAEHLKWIPETFGLREVVATTVAATLTTTPYMLWAFERTTLAGLVTNLFAIPLVGFTMLLGAIALAAAPVFPSAALPASGCLRVLLGIAALADRAPWLSASFALPIWGLFFIYAVMMVIWLRNRAKKTDYPQPEESKLEKRPVLRAFVRAF